jgi:hypothetical protein
MRKGLSLAVGVGFGIGLTVGAVLWALGAPKPMTDAQVEARARTALGMVKTTELPAPKARVSLLVGAETTVAELGAMLKETGFDGDAFVAKAGAKYPEGKPKAGVQVLVTGDAADQLVEQLIAH